MKQIDYELRGMFSKDVARIPLASTLDEDNGYSTTTYSNFVDSYNYADGDSLYNVEQSLEKVDDDILNNSNVISQTKTKKLNAEHVRDYRKGKMDEAQKKYNIVNAISKKSKAEEKQKQDYANEIAFHRGFYNQALIDISVYNNELSALDLEATRLANLKSDLLKSKADLLDAKAKAEARQILATKGTTPEAKQEADRIIAEGKKQSDILKAQADAVSIKSSSRGKLLLILGGLGIVALATVLLLKKN